MFSLVSRVNSNYHWPVAVCLFSLFVCVQLDRGGMPSFD